MWRMACDLEHTDSSFRKRSRVLATSRSSYKTQSTPVYAAPPPCHGADILYDYTSVVLKTRVAKVVRHYRAQSSRVYRRGCFGLWAAHRTHRLRARARQFYASAEPAAVHVDERCEVQRNKNRIFGGKNPLVRSTRFCVCV